MMMRKSRLIYIAILFNIFFSGILSAQIKESTSTMAYELLKGKMIVKMDINGTIEKFIFDTGAASSSLESSFCRTHNMAVVDSTNIRDSGNNLSNYKQVVIQSLRTTDNKFNFKGLKAIVHPENSMFGCFDGVVGLIGSDVLIQMICTIDSKNKTITLTNSTKPLKESLRYAHNFTDNSFLPIFSLQINGESIQKCLFDTGASEFIYMKNEIYNGLIARNAVSVQRVGFGTSAVGLSGVTAVDTSLLVKMENIRFGPLKIKSAYAETANVPFTLIGTPLLDHSKVIIDYPRRRIYFVPYSEEAVTIPTRMADVELTIKEGRLVISSVWDTCKSDVNPGDLVTHVNGEPTGVYEMCDIIRGIALLKSDAPKTLTIQNKDGESKDILYEFKKF